MVLASLLLSTSSCDEQVSAVTIEPPHSSEMVFSLLTRECAMFVATADSFPCSIHQDDLVVAMPFARLLFLFFSFVVYRISSLVNGMGLSFMHLVLLVLLLVVGPPPLRLSKTSSFTVSNMMSFLLHLQ